MRLGLESEEKPPRGSWERASQTAGGREAGRPAGLRGRVGQVLGAAAKVAATMQAGRPNSGSGLSFWEQRKVTAALDLGADTMGSGLSQDPLAAGKGGGAGAGRS